MPTLFVAAGNPSPGFANHTEALEVPDLPLFVKKVLTGFSGHDAGCNVRALRTCERTKGGLSRLLPLLYCYATLISSFFNRTSKTCKTDGLGHDLRFGKDANQVDVGSEALAECAEVTCRDRLRNGARQAGRLNPGTWPGRVASGRTDKGAILLPRFFPGLPF